PTVATMRWSCVWLCFLALSVGSVTDVQARLGKILRNHVSSICSTWGREHFKTFDGDVYQFPGTCEYNLASDCHETFQEFSVHMKRKEHDGNPTVSYVVVTINDLSFHLGKSLVTVNGIPVKLPYYNAGVQVERNVIYLKLQSKVGLVVMWNGDDAVMVEVDRDYANRTCGLCGDFNGVSVYNEFIHNDRKISSIEFGNKHKVHRPNDECEDPYEEEEESAEASLESCKEFVSFFVLACVQDMCGCTNSTSDFCLCSTLSEFSRQCSHAGGQPPNWRTPQFCAKQCPFNMVYEESGSPCMDTCTHQDTSSLCEDHKMDGCFCPSGTVFDDISMRGCIAQSECQCKHNKIYNSGEVYRQNSEECTCFEGQWACKSLPTPATCAVEEGSHVTTFDGKTYTFHGECYYTLAKVESKVNCSSFCPIKLQKINNQLMLNIFSFYLILLTLLDINIFHASSFHILLQTSFGLQIQIQHVPIMQVYVSLEQSYRAKTRGLCGNYNMVLSDDMKTPQGIVEGTAATFCNSWKANLMCGDRQERLDDPCSLSVENENYAKHWCALLLSPDSSFAQCRSAVDPEMYYKRCIYASCNCEKSEACLCAVFSSYARACASKGVFLTDWRENVCDKYTKSCPASQTFSYKHQRCQLTCRSLGSQQQSCISDFLPVDGCSCSDGLYLNENGICVPMAKCSCYHDEVYNVLHIKSISTFVVACRSPKVFFNCSTAGTGEVGLQCARTCLNLDSDDCESTECESGCQCPAGLLDDGKGSCVKESDCPCQHDGHIYAVGRKIPNQCNTCACKSGKWECTEKKCPGTCVIYGSGHYSTFDKKTYGFQGHCAYVALKVNNCGNKTVQENFGVITENVPCGTTGTTCSKTVRVQLGRKEVKLSKGTFEEVDLEEGSVIAYRVRRVGLYLVVESEIGLAVMWDRKTTIRILLEPQHSGEVCGLCGNFDGDGQNDFTTKGQMVVSSLLEFANSWKVSSNCPDVETIPDTCEARPNRHHWAKMMCSIITGETFRDCHKKVDPHPFYENCVKDSCACDSGGDCECFCSAVAAYAQACNEASVCVAWRTPEICPVFCDYYNGPEECKWHYSPCHTPCYKTCLNPQGICSNPIPNLEGCYPVCPEDKPIFDEETQMCVEACPITTVTPAVSTASTTTPPTTVPTSPISTPTTTTTSKPPTTAPTTPTTEYTTPPTTTGPTSPTTEYTTHPRTTVPTSPTTEYTPPPTTTGPTSPTTEYTTRPPTTVHTSPTTEYTTHPPTTVHTSPTTEYTTPPTTGPTSPSTPLTTEYTTTPTTVPTSPSTAETTPTTPTITTRSTPPTTVPTTPTTEYTTPPTTVPTSPISTPTTTTTSTPPTTAPTTPTTEYTTPPTTAGPTSPTTEYTTHPPTTVPTSPTTEYIPPQTTTGPTSQNTPPTTEYTTPPTTVPTSPSTAETTPTTPAITTRSTPPTTVPTTPTTEYTTPPTTVPTSPISTPTTTTTSTPPTTWSEWYDEHDPATDKNDWETYENITNSGKHICANPILIECRSTLYPHLSFDEYLDQSQQVVSCNVSYGLICRKENQPIPPAKCLNCEFRVCCDVCINQPTTPSMTTEPPTTTTRPTSPTTEYTTRPPTTVHTSPTTESTTPPTTVPTSPSTAETTPTTPTTTTTSTPSTTAPTTPTTPPTTKYTTPPPTEPTSPTTAKNTATTPTTTTRSTPPTTRPTSPATEYTTRPPTTVHTSPTTEYTTPPTTGPTSPSTAETTPTTPTTTTTSTPPTTVPITPTTPPTTEYTTPPPTEPTSPTTAENTATTPTTTTRSTPPTTRPTSPTTEYTTRPPTTVHTSPTTEYTTPPTTGPTSPSTTNETFLLCNCTMARCIENNTVEIIPYECPPIQNITCANGKKPVILYDEYHCCNYSACDCECKGWGDPHYITFDGSYYSYQGNCTYILMEEISPRKHLTIYIDNVLCDPTEDVSCPRSIIISYDSQVITLMNHNLIGAVQLEVFRLKLPYSQGDVEVLNSGLNLIFEIPRLNVIITFGINGFSVSLPFEHFGNNTQGHCGTCNNNQADDCMLPGGQLVESCAVMADYWPAKHINPPDCKIPTLLPTSAPEPPPTVTPCKPDSICDMLKSSVFEECHPFVSPDRFFQGCVFDSCHVSNAEVECTSLQTYAAACAQEGICLHWRNHTKLCSKQPLNIMTINCLIKILTLTLACKRKLSHNCVVIFQFNERFEYNCQDCICEESTKTVTCKPKVCPAPPQTNCTGPGFVLVSQTNPSDPCCSVFVCRKTCSINANFSSTLVTMKTHITHKSCQSYQEVQMPYCEGSCNTFTKYSEAAASMQHSCSCCKETRFSNRTIDLHCLNGEVVPYTYIHVEECGCGHTECTRAVGQSARRSGEGDQLVLRRSQIAE
uniref:Mucin 2, oligomeric mucus/gel-forming n=1 Tax=Sparus aurata TaxID=8175 RepID=A0A671WX87_SPAAU